jgi:hypothetical protein
MPPGILDVPYNEAIQAIEGTGPYTWNLTGGTLPPGLSMGSSTADSVPITGTPTALGTYTFIVKVTDSTGNFDEQPVTLAHFGGS